PIRNMTTGGVGQTAARIRLARWRTRACQNLERPTKAHEPQPRGTRGLSVELLAGRILGENSIRPTKAHQPTCRGTRRSSRSALGERGEQRLGSRTRRAAVRLKFSTACSADPLA